MTFSAFSVQYILGGPRFCHLTSSKRKKKSTHFLGKGIILSELVNDSQHGVLACLFTHGFQRSYVELSLANFLQRSSLEQVKGTEWLKYWPLLFVTSLAVLPLRHINQGKVGNNDG